jgi:hypothetical protein
VVVRRSALVVVSVLMLSVAAVAASTSVGAVEKPPKPKPAVPKGPGPFHPFNSFGSSANDNVVLKWNDQALAAIRTIAPPPPVSARALAIMNTHVQRLDGLRRDRGPHPAGRLGPPPGRRAPARVQEHGHQLRRPPGPDQPVPLAGHARARPAVHQLGLGYTTPPTGQPDDPATIGIQAADAVIAARAADGSNQAGGYADTSGYTPTTPPGPLSWQPLPGQTFAVPTGHW